MDIKALIETNESNTVSPSTDMDKNHEAVEKFVARRVREMKDYRVSLGVEERWREADKEYEPTGLDNPKSGRMRYQTDDELGLRARLVPISDVNEDEEWRSRNSDPVLLVKIQTAISIIVDQIPEVELTALFSKYKDTTAFARAAWKRNWQITNAKEVYKKVIFDLCKYGWGIGRTFPRIIQYDKEILTEVDQENSDKNVYIRTKNVWFNDVAKQRLDPFRTWIDEQSEPFDDYSTNDCYYELDFSYDAAKVEFSKYSNFDEYVKEGVFLRTTESETESVKEEEEELKTRRDLVTFGFYENRLRDLYVIRIPKLGVTLHYCPLPNDDGMLSLWHAPWVLRSASNPYGVSMWEIIRQNKELFDKMKNMTMDQLVLSIMKMFFYTGTSNLLSDGKIRIKPGMGHQIVNGKVDFLEIPGPGKEAWEGLRYVKSSMDDDSGIVPTIEGQVTGKTLGEVLTAKESALKRLKTPVDNIAEMMEQDAYIALSWMAQVYSTPEVKQFASLDEMMRFEKENELERGQLFAATDEMGQMMAPYSATYLPQLNLKLEKQGEKLIESREERYFQVGKDIKLDQLYWRGIFKVVPKSIVASSDELDKQRKMQFFNIIAPLLVAPPEIYGKAISQLAEALEIDSKDWLPEMWLQVLQQGGGQPLFLSANNTGIDINQGMGMGKGLQTNQSTMQGQSKTTPGSQSPTVVPKTSIPDVSGLQGTLTGISNNIRNELQRGVL